MDPTFEIVDSRTGSLVHVSYTADKALEVAREWAKGQNCKATIYNADDPNAVARDVEPDGSYTER